MKNNLNSIFQISKPIIGMIHLAGNDQRDRVKRALEELAIYQEEEVNGAIIEDYHGTSQDVYETLRESLTKGLKIVRGVNVLRNPYSAFKLAFDFEARFIQFDSVQTPDLDLELYNRLRKEYPAIAVLGGVGFKYISPTGNPLEIDLAEGKSRCEAIVTTGSGTGIETPVEKLREYKRLLKEFPLIVGAGVNLDNVLEQLQICEGAIVGSYFKPNGNTHLPIDRKRVKDLMDIVRQLRG
ncbi:MAG: BtpA/SgcQ family protein [Nanoarchaeota archaeon]|nr:BtpA/SgcQ family protein [Nanoarchaeota archaeon]